MIHHAAPYFTSAVAYVDTVGIISERVFTPQELRLIGKTCKSIQRIYPQPARFPRSGYKYVFQLPQPFTLELADFLLEEKLHHVNEIHVAMDLLADDPLTVKWISRRFLHRLIKKHKRSRRVQCFENTRYAEKRKYGRTNHASYEEPEDRHYGKPCFHFEVRITGFRQVQRVVPNLHRFSLKDFWKKTLKLRKLDYVQLSRLLPDRRFKGNKRTEYARGVMIAREISEAAGEQDTSAQAIYGFLNENLMDLKRRKRERIIDRVLLFADAEEYLVGLKDGWNTHIQRHLEQRCKHLIEEPTREHRQRLIDMGAKLLEEEVVRTLKRREKKEVWIRKLKKRLGRSG